MTVRTPVAIIPARGGSRRLPRKNILPLNGRPMLGWPVQAARDSGVFSQIIVSTEDTEVADIAAAQGARVIMRPPEMSTDTAHEFEAYRHVLDTLKGEGVEPVFFCGVYATAVMVRPDDLRGAFSMMDDRGADVVMGVSAFDIHPYKALETDPDGYLKMVHPVECRQRSQTYPRYVASNGMFYMIRTAPFLLSPNYYPEKLAGYEIPSERAVDMDTEEDYERAKILMKLMAAASI